VYKFIRCQTHSKCPSVQGWYLVLEPGDIDTLMKFHKGVCWLYYGKFGLDPHYSESESAWLYSPARLAALWLDTVEKHLVNGVTLAINSFSGMLPLSKVEVLEECESQRLVFPKTCEPEQITISRWPRSRHYYLTSNLNRIFTPYRYNTYQAAERAAKWYTDHIISKGC